MNAPTVEELDALAMGAIVLTSGGTCFIKMGYDGIKYGGEWRSPYKIPSSRPVRGEFVDSDYVSKVAARVLYAGEGSPLNSPQGVDLDKVRGVITPLFDMDTDDLAELDLVALVEDLGHALGVLDAAQ